MRHTKWSTVHAGRIMLLALLGAVVARPMTAGEAGAKPAESAKAAPATSKAASPAAAAEAGPVESKDILAREPRTASADVLHVLVGWKELEPAYRGSMDARGKARSKAAADRLARELLAKARKGDDFRALMKEFSEDPGSAETGTSYTATPDAGLVEPFKKLALRLDIGETGTVETVYGYHIIQRVK